MSKQLSFILLALLTLLATSCHRDQRVNVLLVSIDTLRDDHCSVSGYSRETTPNLEALAAQGTRIEQAYSPTSTTGPTHASLFTSLYPVTHGVVKNGLDLDDRFETLAEALGAAGYRTSAVVSSFVLDAKFGYAQGFDSYDADFDEAGSTISRTEFQGHALPGAFDQRGDVTTRKAVEQLERLGASGEPFFLFVHYFDPHAPFDPPAGFADRFPPANPDDDLERSIGAYDAEIAFTDQELGTLFAALESSGLARNTLVIVTADHGEGLMQHGHMNHGVQIYEESVRVPLVFRLPERIASDRTLAGPVELLDLMPTILDLTGIEPPGRSHGRTLAGALERGEPLDPMREVHLHRRHYEAGRIGEIPVAGEKFGIRVGPWKYIEAEAEGTRELYNVESDPGERVNVHDSEPAVVEGLQDRMRTWMQVHRRESTDVESLSPEDREKLEALGYVE